MFGATPKTSPARAGYPPYCFGRSDYGGSLFGGSTAHRARSPTQTKAFGNDGFFSRSSTDSQAGSTNARGTPPSTNPPSVKPQGRLTNSKPGIAASVTQDRDVPVSPDIRVEQSHYIEFGQEIIKVFVGSGDLSKTFVVHTTLLRKHAPVFFDRIMTNETPDVIRLPNTEPEVFSLYVQYMYTQKLPSKPDSVKPDREDHVHETNLLCKHFALVKFVHDDLAAKDAIDAIYAKAHERSLEAQPILPGSIAVSNIYNATDGPCGARTLMVDLYVWRATGQWIKDQRAGDVPYPTEFLSDLAIVLLEQCEDQSMVSMMEKKASEYHDI